MNYNDQIVKIITILKQKYHPLKIYLFGSIVYGYLDKYSDVDMMIVKDSVLPKSRRSVEVEKLLSGIEIPTDFLIFTPQEIQECKNITNHIVNTILKKGKLIYEQN